MKTLVCLALQEKIASYWLYWTGDFVPEGCLVFPVQTSIHCLALADGLDAPLTPESLQRFWPGMQARSAIPYDLRRHSF